MFERFRQKRRIKKMMMAPEFYTRYTYSVQAFDGTVRFKDEKLRPVAVKDTHIGHILVVRIEGEDRNEWIPLTKIGVLNCQPPFIMTGENMLGYESAYRFTYIISGSNIEEFWAMHKSMLKLMKEHLDEQLKFWSGAKKIISKMKPYVPGKSKGGKIFDIVTNFGTEYHNCIVGHSHDQTKPPGPRPIPRGPNAKPKPPPVRTHHSNGEVTTRINEHGNRKR